MPRFRSGFYAHVRERGRAAGVFCWPIRGRVLAAEDFSVRRQMRRRAGGTCLRTRPVVSSATGGTRRWSRRRRGLPGPCASDRRRDLADELAAAGPVVAPCVREAPERVYVLGQTLAAGVVRALQSLTRDTGDGTDLFVAKPHTPDGAGWRLHRVARRDTPLARAQPALRPSAGRAATSCRRAGQRNGSGR